jgi:hypothetical protein
MNVHLKIRPYILFIFNVGVQRLFLQSRKNTHEVKLQLFSVLLYHRSPKGRMDGFQRF